MILTFNEVRVVLIGKFLRHPVELAVTIVSLVVSSKNFGILYKIENRVTGMTKVLVE